MISHLVLFAILIGAGGFCITFSQKRFEETLPLTCAGIVLLMFTCGSLGMLAGGVYLVLACSITMYIVSIITIIRKKRWNAVCKRLFTPGFVLFCLLYVILTILHVGRMAQSWDEFSHWADVVKAMFSIDDFITNPLSNSFFPSYMPGMPLFQYFGQKLHQILDPDKGFSEWRLYFCYQIFSYAFLFPFLKNISFKKLLSSATLFAMICLSPMVFFEHYFPTTVYIDAFVGIVAGSGFAMLYVNRQKDTVSYLNLLSAISILVLAKDVGLLFAVFLAIATIIDYAIAWRKEQRVSSSKRFGWMKQTGLIIGVVTAAFLPKLLWNANIAVHHVKKSFSNPIDFSLLLDVFNGADNTYRTEVLQSFTQRFYTGTYSIGSHGIILSWFAIFAILSIILISIHLAFSKDKQERTARRIIITIVISQTCLYILGLCVIYMFKFKMYEATRLASFERYIGIILLTMQMMAMLLFFSYMQKYTQRWYSLSIIAMASVLLVMPKDSVLSFINRSSVTASIESRVPYEMITSRLHDLTFNERKKVFIISQGSTGYEYYVLKYSMRPCITDIVYDDIQVWSLSTTGPLYEGDIWTHQRSAEQWKEELRSYDYVLIYHVDDIFIQDYSSAFADPSQIRDNTIFAVNHETGLLDACQ